MKAGLTVLFLTIFATAGWEAHLRHQDRMRPLDPANRPGEICDRVAKAKEPKPTVAWYHACITFAADLESGKVK